MIHSILQVLDKELENLKLTQEPLLQKANSDSPDDGWGPGTGESPNSTSKTSPSVKILARPSRGNEPESTPIQRSIQVTLEDSNRTQPVQPGFRILKRDPNAKANNNSNSNPSRNGPGNGSGSKSSDQNKSQASNDQQIRQSYTERLSNYKEIRKRILGDYAPHEEDAENEVDKVLKAATSASSPITPTSAPSTASQPTATNNHHQQPIVPGNYGQALLPTPDTPPMLYGGSSSGSGRRQTPDMGPVPLYVPILRQPAGPDGTRGFTHQQQQMQMQHNPQLGGLYYAAHHHNQQQHNPGLYFNGNQPFRR